MKNQIIFVGIIDKIAKNGEAMKNQLFVKRFREIYKRVYVYDALGTKHKPYKLLKLIYLCLLHRKTPIFISASPGVGQPLVRLMWLLGRKDIYYWMVGGSFHDKIKEGSLSSSFYKKIYALIVQNERMKFSLEKNGFSNVYFVPNSKRINYLPDIHNRNNKKLRFVFLSRIHPTKGCGEIIESVKELNNRGYNDRFLVDFYGEIDECYTNFVNQINQVPNIEYKGFLDLTQNTGYDILATYDMMLFPTYWVGEGFPGVIIDSYIAGVPVIASNWNLNTDYIKNDETGVIIPHHNQKRLMEEMENVLCGLKDLKKMAIKCQQQAMLYDNRKVITTAILSKMGAI